jgi:hypothetical protein
MMASRKVALIIPVGSQGTWCCYMVQERPEHPVGHGHKHEHITRELWGQAGAQAGHTPGAVGHMPSRALLKCPTRTLQGKHAWLVGPWQLQVPASQ